MYKNATFIFFLILGGIALQAQNNGMYTKYIFNSLAYNPAYAGYYDHLYVGTSYKDMWQGIDGAPTTQTLTIHTPLRSAKVAMGLNLVNDAIGPIGQTKANLSYSYRIPLGGTNILSIGIQGGLSYWRADLKKLSLAGTSLANTNSTRVSPNFGAGILFYNKSFYVGVSSPQVVEQEYRFSSMNNLPFAKEYRRSYFAAGAAIPIKGERIVFKPSILVKNVGLFSEVSRNVGALTEYDVDLSLLFNQGLQIGVSFRSAIETFYERSSFNSSDIWMSYQLKNGLRLGASFENTVTFDSFEVMVGYQFNYRRARVTKRYF